MIGTRAGRRTGPWRRGALLWLVLLVTAGACAPRTTPVPPGAPRFPDYPFPVVPADLARAPQVRSHQAAWAVLQAGDVRRARAEFERLVRRSPAFYPALAGSGFAALAAGDPAQALTAFDRVLARAPTYVPALVGRGEALIGLRRTTEALESLEAALALDATLTDVRRRIDAIRFRGVNEQLAMARAARRAGQLAAARAAYERALAASPGSAFVYRELAEVERDAGEPALALSHAQRAAELDPADPDTAILVGELHEVLGDDDAAVAAYQRALALDVRPDIQRRIDAIGERRRLAALPAGYRDLPNAERATRGDLAGLIGIRLPLVLKAAPARGSGLVTDVRSHWAAEWIPAVARAGIVEALPNHTFQPRAVLRRSDLAVAVHRLLTVIAARDPALASTWQLERVSFTDLPAGHALHAAASAAVAAGVMSRVDGGAFRPSRPVTGAEAVAAIDRLEVLAARAGLARQEGTRR